jgi:hypothetical protein
VSGFDESSDNELLLDDFFVDEGAFGDEVQVDLLDEFVFFLHYM